MKSEQAVLPNPCLEEEEEDTKLFKQLKTKFPIGSQTEKTVRYFLKVKQNKVN
jgi:hypothetical protein